MCVRNAPVLPRLSPKQQEARISNYNSIKTGTAANVRKATISGDFFAIRISPSLVEVAGGVYVVSNDGKDNVVEGLDTLQKRSARLSAWLRRSGQVFAMQKVV